MAALATDQQVHPFDNESEACFSADGFTVICSGDWSGGVLIDNTIDHGGGSTSHYDELILSGAGLPVDAVTGRPTVTPDEGKFGIDILTNGDFTVQTDPAGFDIVATGLDIHGILFRNNTVNETVNVSLQHYGNIEAHGKDGRGILFWQRGGTEGLTNRVIDVDYYGDITTYGTGTAHGIQLRLEYAQFDLFHAGDIATLSAGDGIHIWSQYSSGPVSVTNIGNIASVHGYAIFAKTTDAPDSDLSVGVMGDVYSGVTSLYVSANDGGDVVVNYLGNMQSGGTGIYAVADAYDFAGDVTVNAIGNIVSPGSPAVFAGIMSPGSNATVNLGRFETGGIVVESAIHNGQEMSGVRIRANQYGVASRGGVSGSFEVNLYNRVDIAADYNAIRGHYTNDVINNYGIFTYTGDINLALLDTFWAGSKAVNLNGLSDEDRQIIYDLTPDSNGDFSDILNLSVLSDFDLSTLGRWEMDLLQIIVEAGDNTGLNQIYNHPGATFNSDARIYLYNPEIEEVDGTFYNYGNLSPGGTEPRQLFEAVYDELDGSFLLDEVWTSEIQTTTIYGNFINEATGSYFVNINADGESDLLRVVGGTVTLNGGTVVVHADGYLFDTPYTILTSETEIFGAFDEVVDTAFVSASTQVSQVVELDTGSPYKVDLIVTKSADPCDFSMTENQVAVGCGPIEDQILAAETLATDNDIVQAVLQLETDVEVREAYDMLSGEPHASLAGVLIEEGNLRRQELLRRSLLANDLAPVADAYGLAMGNTSQPSAKTNWWTSAQGNRLERDDIANSKVTAAALTNQSYGFMIGVDNSRDGFTLGLAGGWSMNDTSVDDRNYSSDTETWSLATYGAARIGATRLLFGALADWHEIDSHRNVVIDTFSEHLSADYDATTWQAYLEVEHRLDLIEGVRTRPFARLAHVQHKTVGFVEISSGDDHGDAVADTAALDVDDSSTGVTYSVLGVRNSFAMEGIALDTSLGWRHAFGGVDPAIDVVLAGFDVLSITGSPVAEDTLVAHLSAVASIRSGVDLATRPSGQLSEESHAVGVNLELSGRF